MKLNTAQVEQALSQFDAQALPENHPAIPQLCDLFGEHTFFLDRSGLNVLEEVEAPEASATHAGTLVNLASWSNSDMTSLVPHPPEPTGVVVMLDARH